MQTSDQPSTTGGDEVSSVETHARLVEAGRHLLAEGPESEITVAGIVDHAEVARSTFYAHFESKAAFVADIHRRNQTRVESSLRQLMDDQPPHIALGIVVAHAIAFAESEPTDLKSMLATYEGVFGSTGGVHRLVERTIEAGVADGVFAMSGSARLATILFRSCAHAAAGRATLDDATSDSKNAIYLTLRLLGTPREKAADAVTAARMYEQSLDGDWLRDEH